MSKDAKLAGALLALGLLALAFPRSDDWTFATFGVGVVLALTFGVLVAVAVNRRRLMTALLVTLFGLAYAYRSVEGMTIGVDMVGMHARNSDVLLGVCLLGFFLTVVSGVASLTFRLLSRLRAFRRVLSAGVSTEWRYAVTGGLLVVLVASGVVAFQTGSWTFYGAEHDAEFGGFQLDMVYFPVLMACAFVFLRRFFLLLGAGRRVVWHVLVLGALFALLFFLQNRRLFIAAVAGGALMPFCDGVFIERFLKKPVRAVALVAVAVGLMLVSVYGSTAWRASSGSTLPERLGNTVETAQSGPVESNIDARMTYLWTDALLVGLDSASKARFSLWESFIGSLANRVPAVLFPSKLDFPYYRCEWAFETTPLGGQDMACTPVGEGFIAFGWLGVFLVALAWGVFVGLADYAWQFPSPWAVIVATQLVLQMFDIEASAWPMSSGIRNLLLLVGLVWVPALVFRVVLLTGAPERLPPGRPPRAV